MERRRGKKIVTRTHGQHKGMICYRSLFPARPIARSIVQKCANDDAPRREKESNARQEADENARHSLDSYPSDARGAAIELPL